MNSTHRVSPLFSLLLTALALGPGCARNDTEKEKPSPARPQPTAAVPLPVESLNLDDKVKAALNQHKARKATIWLALADRLKAGGRYEEAAVDYLVALKLDPNLSKAAYQMGCNCALWGKPGLAFDYLNRACDAGFWGYDEFQGDDDLVSLRGRPQFQAIAARLKTRYEEEAPKHAGGAVMHKPAAGTPVPPGGYPILIAMHGYGSNKENLEDLAKLAARKGFVGISVSAPVVMGPGSYRWPGDSVETTHRYLQATLAKYQGDKALDFKRVYLSGFSQGALHATLLVFSKPEVYSGGLAISPGGRVQQMPNLSVAPVGPPRPLFLVSGRKEYPGNIQLAKLYLGTWEKMHWPVHIFYHPGGHNFPKNWETVFGQALVWLRNDGKGTP